MMMFAQLINRCDELRDIEVPWSRHETFTDDARLRFVDGASPKGRDQG